MPPNLAANSYDVHFFKEDGSKRPLRMSKRMYWGVLRDSNVQIKFVDDFLEVAAYKMPSRADLTEAVKLAQKISHWRRFLGDVVCSVG